MTRYVSDALFSLFLQGLNRASENNHSIELNGKVHAKCSILDLSHGKLLMSVSSSHHYHYIIIPSY